MILKQYALSQIISLDKDKKIENKKEVPNLEEQLGNGYVITNVYLLNHSKEEKERMKVMCSGYYLDKGKIKYLFSNRLFTFDKNKLLDNIVYVKNTKDNIGIDILTENDNLSIITNN